MKVLVAGDFCPLSRLAKAFDEDKFNEVLGDVREVIFSADYSIANFECPITKGGEEAISKRGPNLRCSSKGMEAIRWTGFNGVTIANNHILDYGERGIENTITACKQNKIDVVGGGRNLQEASSILYKDIQGKKIAIINCCEHEFSVATEEKAGANPLNPIQQYYSIKEAKNKADYVLVIVHGGHEHFRLPSPRIQETYKFFIDAGADAVVNHHQHCYSGYEVYKDKPIFYGIGNFCFDWDPVKNDNLWNYGYMVMLTFSEESVRFELLPYKQCAEEVKVELLPENAFDNEIKRINSIIGDTAALKKAVEEYYKKSLGATHRLFEPYQNKFLLGAQNRGWIPYLLGKGQRLRLQNCIICESHLEKIKYFFNYLYKNN